MKVNLDPTASNFKTSTMKKITGRNYHGKRDLLLHEDLVIVIKAK